MEVKINSIKESGLPRIVSMRRKMKILMPQITNTFLPSQLISMGPIPFSAALDTVIWFAYGEKPEAPNVEVSGE